MGTDDIGVAVESVLASLNDLRQKIRNGSYVEEGDAINEASATFLSTTDAFIAHSDQKDAILTALAAYQTTLDALIANPDDQTAILAAIDTYLTALDAIVNPV